MTTSDTASDTNVLKMTKYYSFSAWYVTYYMLLHSIYGFSHTQGRSVQYHYSRNLHLRDHVINRDYASQLATKAAPTLDYFTVFLHSPKGRLALRKEKWVKNGNFHRSHEVIKHCSSTKVHCRWGFLQSVFRPSPSQSDDANQLKARSHTPLTVLQPPG